MFEYFKQLTPIGLCVTSPNADETIEIHINAYKASIALVEEYILKHNSDLVEVSNPNCCCPECAKYTGRIYSLKGLDKRFPKFPRWFAQTQCAHCGIQIYPFIYGFSSPTYVEGDIFETSNRPFVDDRPQEYIDMYNQIIAEYLEDLQDRNDYAYLQQILPDATPKSYSAYRRMKNQKTKGYLKLVETAAEHGIELPL